MKNKKGFTLVELLAVIVILGVLLVTATPMVFNAIKDSKKKTKCKVVKEVATQYESFEYLYKNKKECIRERGKCYFGELMKYDKVGDVNDESVPIILEEDMTSPITGEIITEDEKDDFYVSSSGCSGAHNLYTDKNGISVCYEQTIPEDFKNLCD